MLYKRIGSLISKKVIDLKTTRHRDVYNLCRRFIEQHKNDLNNAVWG